MKAKPGIIIGNNVVSMEDLGDIADMRIDLAMQALVDRGHLGSFAKGTPWYKVINPEISLLGRPEADEELLENLWLKFKEAEEVFMDDQTTENRTIANAALREYQMTLKLSRP